jgi:hypothetical protein
LLNSVGMLILILNTMTLYLNVLTDQWLYLVELYWNHDLANQYNDPVPECVDQCLYLVELCWNADLANEYKAGLPSRRKIHALNKKHTLL